MKSQGSRKKIKSRMSYKKREKKKEKKKKKSDENASLVDLM